MSAGPDDGLAFYLACKDDPDSLWNDEEGRYRRDDDE